MINRHVTYKKESLLAIESLNVFITQFYKCWEKQSKICISGT